MIRADAIAYLLTLSAITDVVDRRVRPRRLPQGETLPAIAVRILDTQGDEYAAGESGLHRTTLEFVCHGTSQDQADTLADLVRKHTCGQSGTWGSSQVRGTFLQDLSDEYSPPTKGDETGHPAVTVTVDVWHRVAVA